VRGGSTGGLQWCAWQGQPRGARAQLATAGSEGGRSGPSTKERLAAEEEMVARLRGSLRWCDMPRGPRGLGGDNSA
jgi:hypothetical protein